MKKHLCGSSHPLASVSQAVSSSCPFELWGHHTHRTHLQVSGPLVTGTRSSPPSWPALVSGSGSHSGGAPSDRSLVPLSAHTYRNTAQETQSLPVLCVKDKHECVYVRERDLEHVLVYTHVHVIVFKCDGASLVRRVQRQNHKLLTNGSV